MATAPKGFRAVGLLADYAEVEEKFESAIEQFLRDELEYVVVETFDSARAGVSLLRDEMGGRATFFVDSLSSLNITPREIPDAMPETPGVLARLDRLVKFREPLGPAMNQFLSKLQTAYVVEESAIAENLASAHPQFHFLTSMAPAITAAWSAAAARRCRPARAEARIAHAGSRSQRASKPKPPKRKAKSRIYETEITRADEWLAVTLAQHVEAEKEVVAATHQLAQARAESSAPQNNAKLPRTELAALRAEMEGTRTRAIEAEMRSASAQEARAAAESESAAAADRLAQMRQSLQAQQEELIRKREDLAAISERLASAESLAQRIEAEATQAQTPRHAIPRAARRSRTRAQRSSNESSSEIARQAESLRAEKFRMEESQAALESEWETARTRAAQLDDALRGQRQSLDDQRAQRTHCEVEKARNDSDREYLRQSCVAELNAQPEELIGTESVLLTGEELIAAETNYNEMKARVEAMGPVNMMALEEYQECEQRDGFLRRERDDLVESIQNTQQAISELDQVSRQKFEEAFTAINASFAIAFQ